MEPVSYLNGALELSLRLSHKICAGTIKIPRNHDGCGFRAAEELQKPQELQRLWDYKAAGLQRLRE